MYSELRPALAGPADDFVQQQGNLIRFTLCLRGPEAVLKLIQTEPNIGPNMRNDGRIGTMFENNLRPLRMRLPARLVM